MRLRTVVFVIVLALGIRAANAPASAGALPAIAINDNRLPAGTRAGDTVHVSLVARLGAWRPDGPHGLAVPIAAFGEPGKPLQVPGPLVRVSAGTAVFIRVQNAIADRTIVIHGLDVASGVDRPVILHSGEQRAIQFRRTVPGTYGYWTSDIHTTDRSRFDQDAELAGAIVVDDPHRPRPNDRVFVITDWDHVWNKDGSVNFAGEVLTINGAAWPATERLTYTHGQTVRWRVYNASLIAHPMHLHGFPFTLDAVGNGNQTESFAGASAHREVTHRIAPGETFDAHWVADRVGEWMFHCHISVHILPHAPLAPLIAGRDPGRTLEAALHLTHHTIGGMMMAVNVVPAHGEAALQRPAGAMKLALDVVQLSRPADQKRPFDDFAYVLHRGGTVDRGSGTLGPLIVLHAGEPAAISVNNDLKEDTTVHWHGMPVQNSIDDGGMAMDAMPGMTAMPGMAGAPVIAPGTSFVARFTPEYAGTFMYHTHMDDTWQLVGGLAGPLVVLPRGATYDPATDHIVMVTSPPDHAFGDRVSVNGYLENAPPIVMHAGVPQRLRLINMTVVNPNLSFSLDGAPKLTWTPLAIDGIDLNPTLRQPERAIQRVTIGQTRDFTFVPSAPGHLTLQAFGRSPVGQIAVDVVP